MRSPIAFYQMVGRGTRLNPATGKLMFRVYDYTNATRLFGEDVHNRGAGDAGGRRRTGTEVRRRHRLWLKGSMSTSCLRATTS